MRASLTLRTIIERKHSIAVKYLKEKAEVKQKTQLFFPFAPKWFLKEIDDFSPPGRPVFSVSLQKNII